MTTEYRRDYPLFSLCGLNCGLCPRFHTEGTSRCPGCCGEGFSKVHPPCGVISCSRRHGDVAYCHLCEEFPCARYDHAQDYDSFITHQNMMKDFARAKEMGMDAYRAELNAKVAILHQLLDTYNDGRRKSYFCLAVNLLPLDDLCEIMAQLAAEVTPAQPVKERAQAAARRLDACAQGHGITLKLKQKGKA